MSYFIHPSQMWMPCYILNYFTRAAIKKCHRLGGLNNRDNRDLFSQSPGGYEFKTNVLVGLASSEIFILDL